jgi:hypothetical protein
VQPFQDDDADLVARASSLMSWSVLRCMVYAATTAARPLTAFDTRQTGSTPAVLAGRPPADVVLAGLDAPLTSPPYVTVAHHAPTEAGILRHYAYACPALAASTPSDWPASAIPA